MRTPAGWRCRALVAAAGMVLATALCAQPIAPGAALERLPLVAETTSKAWSPAESNLQWSTARAKTGEGSWHWHIAVDHFTGEPKYPIGWPRITRPIAAGPLRDWSAWDFLHAWIYTDTSRAALPRDPVGLGLHTPDRANAFHRSLSTLKKGEWVQVLIPLNEIPRHQDVRQIQFNIAESNYKHGDTLDFFINDLAVIRYAEPTIVHFSAENGVVLADARLVSAALQLSGVKAAETKLVVCELRQQDRVVARSTTQATRGMQRVALPLGQSRVAAGEYQLTACVAGTTRVATASVRLVESPWK